MRFDPLKRLAVHARRAPMQAAPAGGFPQDVLPIQLVPQAIEAKTRFGLSFPVQRHLQLLNR
jgi:hypothetical protein